MFTSCKVTWVKLTMPVLSPPPGMLKIVCCASQGDGRWWPHAREHRHLGYWFRSTFLTIVVWGVEFGMCDRFWSRVSFWSGVGFVQIRLTMGECCNMTGGCISWNFKFSLVDSADAAHLSDAGFYSRTFFRVPKCTKKAGGFSSSKERWSCGWTLKVYEFLNQLTMHHICNIPNKTVCNAGQTSKDDISRYQALF